MDGGGALTAVQGFHGGVAPGDDGVVGVIRDLGYIFHGDAADVRVQEIPLGMAGEDEAHGFLQFRVGDDK